MIEQTTEELAEAMQQDPVAWAKQYNDLMTLLHQLSEKNQQLTLQLLPVNDRHKKAPN